MKIIQRVTSFLLALIMVIGMMPAAAVSAEENESAAEAAAEETVAETIEETAAATEAATEPVEETIASVEAEMEPVAETTAPTEDQTQPAEPAEEFVLGSESMDAQSIASENGFTYNIYTTDSGTEAACIMRYVGGDVNVVVPDTLGGYPVGKIGNDAFCDNPELESVALPEGITELEDGNSGAGAAVYGAFAYCYNLKSVTLPQSLTKIGSYAFYNCKILPELNLPDNLKNIGNHAFYGCSSLTKLEFPEGLKTVGSNALNGTGITSLHLPDSVTTIDLTGLSQQLTDIRWTAGIPVIDGNRFRDFVALETVVLPEGVTEIADHAFAYCYNLKDITLPGSLKKIGANAFYSCKTLSQIKLPKNLETIGDNAFYDCSALTQLEFPAGLKTIGNQAMFGTGITSLELPDSVTAVDLTGLSQQLTDIRWTAGIPVLENGLFQEFVALETVVLPEGVTELADGPLGVFDCCYNLKNVTLPQSLTKIGAYAFLSCKTLSQIELPVQLETIGDKAFYDCGALTQLKFPDGLKTIGMQALSGTGITSLYLPDSVTAVDLTGLSYQLLDIRWTAGIPVIDNTRFQNFVTLETVVLPEGVTELAAGEPHAGGISGVFAFCYNLTSITLPGSLTKIGDFAFLECEMLTEVRYSGRKAQWNALTENMGLNNGSLVDSATLYYMVLVDYVTNMEQTLDSGEIQNGDIIPMPGLEREGYTLCGWYTDAEFANEWNFADPVTEDMTLYAKWMSDHPNVCIVTFVTNMEQNIQSSEIQIGDILSMPVLEWEGYTLCGWFTDEALTEEWNVADPVTESMTLYAKWLPNELDKNEEDTGICIEILNEDGFVYNGKAIKPEIVVRDGGRILTAGTDYSVSYKNNTNACDKNSDTVKDSKNPRIIVQGKGNYKSSRKITKYFTIHQAEMKELQITLPEFVACKAKNKSQTVKAVVSTGLVNVAASNYVIHYYSDEALTAEVKGITAAGTYYVTLEAKLDKNGNYSGNFTGVSDVFTIQAVAADKLLSSAKITVPKTITAVEVQPDENTAIKALISKIVMNKRTWLTEDIEEFTKQFAVTAADTDGNKIELGELLTSAGKKMITVSPGSENPEGFFGKKTISVTVKGIPLNKKQFQVTFGEKDAKAVTKVTYTGESQIPAVFSELEEGEDYSVTYKQGKTLLTADQVKNAGNYSLMITGKGNYSGTLTYSFSINKQDLGKAYTAGELKIGEKASAVYTPLGAKVKPVVTFNGETLAEGTDFTISFSGNKTVTDSASMTLKGKGNFSGTLDKKKAAELFYSITPKDLSTDGIAINVTGLTFNKKGEITGAKYTVTHDGKPVPTKQYSGALSDNGETVRLTITGKDPLYTGSKFIDISRNLIKTSDSKKVKIILPKENRYYTGSPIRPDVIITDAEGNDISGCFDITYGENTKVGSGSITITGIPEKGYYGAKTLKFTILPRWTKWIFG